MNKVRELAVLLGQMRAKTGDPEHDHSVGDDILCKALQVLASTEEERPLVDGIIHAFDDMEKWYA